jgi:hypothetical protein
MLDFGLVEAMRRIGDYAILLHPPVSSTGIEHVVNRVVYCATGTEIYISAG